jgi:hypothetical protein
MPRERMTRDERDMVWLVKSGGEHSPRTLSGGGAQGLQWQRACATRRAWIR